MTLKQTKLQKTFDRIGSLVPGYASYNTKENLRSNDTLLRKLVARSLDSVIAKIELLKRLELSHGNIENIAKLSSVGSELIILSNVYISEKRGYSAIFQKNQIDEELLLEVSSLDEKYIDASVKLEKFEKNLTKIDQLDEIGSLIDICKEILKQRAAMLSGT